MTQEHEFTRLRVVPIEQIAQYLKCDAGRLAKAFKRLAKTPSVVLYGPGQAAAVIEAEMNLRNESNEKEILRLEALMAKQDLRSGG